MLNNLHIHSFNKHFDFEMVERKGKGHPDTICDCVAEQVSIALCNYYLNEFGAILHHNVDKALLVGGKSSPKYNGGKIIQPIELFIAGRATNQVNGKRIPIEEIAANTARNWLKNNLRFLDVEKHIIIIPKMRSGSHDLVELFQRFKNGETPLANDTSFGVGFYPDTFLEEKVMEIEILLNNKDTKALYPFIGEDIKVMGVQNEEISQFTIAIAMVDRYVSGIDDYKSKLNSVKEFIETKIPLINSVIEINTADNYKTESIYLTVTGTSAEGGDDGQVGRGNRINGLITPYKPMSLEATSGKNPISHIGKIYNVFALDLCKAIYESGFAEEAHVYIVSQIGKPITRPQLLEIKLKNQKVENYRIEELVGEKLNSMPMLWHTIIKNKYDY